MDFERLNLEPSRSDKPRVLQRVIALVAAVVIFSFVASTFHPRNSSAAGPSGRPALTPSVLAGGGGKQAVPSAQRVQSGPEQLNRLETGGRTAPVHPRGLKPLGNMLGREYLVWIYSEKDEPRYTICKRTGDVIAADLTAQQVYAQFPDLDIEHLGVPTGDGSGPWMMAPQQD